MNSSNTTGPMTPPAFQAASPFEWGGRFFPC